MIIIKRCKEKNILSNKSSGNGVDTAAGVMTLELHNMRSVEFASCSCQRPSEKLVCVLQICENLSGLKAVLLRCMGLVCIVLLSCVFCCYIMCILCVTALYTLDDGLLARGQYPEGPATGHLDTGFFWFPCVCL